MAILFVIFLRGLKREPGGTHRHVVGELFQVDRAGTVGVVFGHNVSHTRLAIWEV